MFAVLSMDWQRSHLPITQAKLIRAGIGCTMGTEYVTPRPDIAYLQGDEPILYGYAFPFWIYIIQGLTGTCTCNAVLVSFPDPQ